MHEGYHVVVCMFPRVGIRLPSGRIVYGPAALREYFVLMGANVAVWPAGVFTVVSTTAQTEITRGSCHSPVPRETVTGRRTNDLIQRSYTDGCASVEMDRLPEVDNIVVETLHSGFAIHREQIDRFTVN